MDGRETLDEVRAQYGAVTPRNTVEYARPDDSPAHDRFEWDEHENSEAYLLIQARDFIRSVRVSFVDSDGRSRSTRAFVSVTPMESPSAEYVPIEEVKEDPVLRAMALRTAEREWRSLYTKYNHMEEFMTLVREQVA